MKKIALSIAGSDPSGGAGIQADLKVFDRLGVYGMAVPAALTAQSSKAVSGTRSVPPEFLREQLVTLLSDVTPDAVKTGMLMDARNVRETARALSKLHGVPVIVDPVMVSTSGRRLLTKQGVRVLVEELIPLCRLVTPNTDEAAALAGMEVRGVEDMELAARKIQTFGAGAVLVKGGHITGDPVDVFFDGDTMLRLRSKRIPGGPYHGTGCVLSAAIAAYMARSESIVDGIKKARMFLSGLMRKTSGSGQGPLV